MHKKSGKFCGTCLSPQWLLIGLLFSGCKSPDGTHQASAAGEQPPVQEFEPSDPDRPPPPLPERVLLLGNLADMDLSITADRAGQIQQVSISKPSKIKVLDEYTRDWVEKHWKMAPAKPDEPNTRQFIAPIVYNPSSVSQGGKYPDPFPKGGKYPAPYYPQFALRNNVQGRVGLRIMVDESGHVVSATVLISSGSPVLDEHTRSWVEKHWEFPPGIERAAYWICTYQMQ